MRVLIETEVELYPQTVMLFGDSEIVFPHVQREWEKTAGSEVPDEVAERWKAARDAWRQAQQEAEAYVGYRRD
jgi:ribonuclease HI